LVKNLVKNLIQMKMEQQIIICVVSNKNKLCFIDKFGTKYEYGKLIYSEYEMISHDKTFSHTHKFSIFSKKTGLELLEKFKDIDGLYGYVYLDEWDLEKDFNTIFNPIKNLSLISFLKINENTSKPDSLIYDDENIN
jgi:hypothetical protein